MSTIFGGLFFVIIILMGFNVMLWGFIQYDAYNHVISSNSYRISLATTRGRLFNLYYPWRFSSSIFINNGGGGNFVTNVGPLAVYFDFRSFNYTQGTQTTSNPAFCMTPGSSLIYVRIANTSTNATVTIESSTMMQMQPYSANGFGQFVRAWVLAPNSINPSTEFAYNYVGNPYVLQPSGPNGPVPASFAILKIGATGQNGLGAAGLSSQDNWLTFIGIYYMYNGQPQGETIPFMDFRTSSGAPVCNS